MKQFKILAAIFFLVFTVLLLAPNVLASPTGPAAVSTSVWSHTYGTASLDDYNQAKVIQTTKDGGYIVAGEVLTKPPVSVPTAFNKAWLLKLDSQGHQKWETTIQITALTGEPYDTYVTGVKQTRDNGYAVIGSYSNRAYAGKLDSNGKITWLHDIGLGNAESLDLTSDGGFIIAGATPTLQAWLYRLNSKGESVWKRSYTDTRLPLLTSSAKSVQTTSDGGFIVAGELGTAAYSQRIDLWVFKTDKNGLIKWEKTYQTPQYTSTAIVVQEKTRTQKQSGYIVLALRHDGQRPIDSVWLLSLDKNGNVQWQKSIGENTLPIALVQLKSGGYVIVTRESGLNGGVIKVSSRGSILWHRDYAREARMRFFNSISEARDSGLVIAGSGLDAPGNAWIIKTNSAGNCCRQLTTSLSTPVTVLKTTVTQAHAIASPSHPTSTKLSSYNVTHTLLTVRVQC